MGKYTEIYQKEVKRLSEKTPEEIFNIWNQAKSPLFEPCTQSRMFGYCPTQQVNGYWDELKKFKHELGHLQLPNPEASESIEISDLPKFAAAQEIIDQLIPDRDPPKQDS